MIKELKLFRNKKVLITGHNGFKGSWLTIWFSLLGARVIGISLRDKNPNNHLNLVKRDIKIKSYYFDIRNKSKLENVILKEKPDYIFHLAAQSLVYKSILDTELLGNKCYWLLNLLEQFQNEKEMFWYNHNSDECYKT